MRAKTQGTRERVLLVDDDVAMAETMKAVLEYDFDVESATSGQQALEILDGAYRAGTPFQVLCTDFQMPNMNGLQLLDHLSRRGDDVVGLLVTGMRQHVMEYLSTSTTDQGILFSVLLKPFPPQQLVDVVGSAARLARMKQTFEPRTTAARV